MLSSSADAKIKLWQTLKDSDNGDDSYTCSGKVLATLCYENPKLQDYDTPTSLSWIHGKASGIIVGYAESNSLVFFDSEQVTS